MLILFNFFCVVLIKISERTATNGQLSFRLTVLKGLWSLGSMLLSRKHHGGRESGTETALHFLEDKEVKERITRWSQCKIQSQGCNPKGPSKVWVMKISEMREPEATMSTTLFHTWREKRSKVLAEETILLHCRKSCERPYFLISENF